MRKCMYLLLPGLLCSLSGAEAQQVKHPAIEGTVVAELGPGEKMVYGENCFMLNTQDKEINFVTSVTEGDKILYYRYDKGIKKGPFKTVDLSLWQNCMDNSGDRCAVFEQLQSGEWDAYVKMEGTTTIQFNGKTYGPFMQIMQFYLTQDKKQFYAIALTPEMKIVFLDSKERTIKVTGMPDKLIVSPDGNYALIKCTGTINPFDPEAVKEMLNNPQQLNNPSINICGIDGKQYGPYSSSDFGDVWFDKNNHWLIRTGKTYYMNGSKLFENTEWINACDLWISADGKLTATVDYEKIKFSDDVVAPHPLAINVIKADGKTFLTWISLENDKNLVVYKRTF